MATRKDPAPTAGAANDDQAPTVGAAAVAGDREPISYQDAVKAQGPVPLMSEGVRQELETYRRVGDPVAGGTWERDDKGKITYTDRSGKVTPVDGITVEGR